VSPVLLATLGSAPKHHHAALQRMFKQGSQPLRSRGKLGMDSAYASPMDRGLQAALQMTRTSHPMTRGPKPRPETDSLIYKKFVHFVHPERPPAQVRERDGMPSVGTGLRIEVRSISWRKR